MSLSVNLAFDLFFLDKFQGDGQIQVSRVNADIQPQFCKRRLNDVHVCTVQGSHIARGRVTVVLGLTCRLPGWSSCMPCCLAFDSAHLFY